MVTQLCFAVLKTSGVSGGGGYIFHIKCVFHFPLQILFRIECVFRFALQMLLVKVSVFHFAEQV